MELMGKVAGGKILVSSKAQKSCPHFREPGTLSAAKIDEAASSGQPLTKAKVMVIQNDLLSGRMPGLFFD